MDRSRFLSPISARPREDLFDSLTCALGTTLPRRGVLGLLAVAAAASGAGSQAVTTSAAHRRRRKRSKRRPGQHGIAVSARATSIPPNCIYVCCDGTCDSWKMCMKCVKWPKPTTTSGVLTQG